MAKFACFFESIKIKEYEVEFETIEEASEFFENHIWTACFSPGYTFAITSKDKQYCLIVEHKS